MTTISSTQITPPKAKPLEFASGKDSILFTFAGIPVTKVQAIALGTLFLGAFYMMYSRYVASTLIRDLHDMSTTCWDGLINYSDFSQPLTEQAYKACSKIRDYSHGKANLRYFSQPLTKEVYDACLKSGTKIY